MCRWIFIECKYLKYRIRTDILRRPDRFMKLNEILITQDMFDVNGKLIPERVNNPLNLDKEIREYRQQEKEGKPLWWS